MEAIGYLLVQQNGSMRVVKRMESSKGGDVSIKLRVNVPDDYWTTPMLSARLTLPEKTTEVNETSAIISFEALSPIQSKPEKEEDLEDI